MKIGYIDAFSGISGDMLLGALVNVGVSQDMIREELLKLPLSGYEFRVSQVKRCGVTGIKVDVDIDQGEQSARGFKTIKNLIESSSLEEAVKKKAIDVFTRLAEAEANIHGVCVENVHFHEVGGVDSIIDIIGAVIGLESLGLDKLFCSPVNVGGGTAKTQHGDYPVPAPATLELLKGVPVYSNGSEMEMTTPTGAAVISSCVNDFISFPSLITEQIGYGAGSCNPSHFPNMLRFVVGRQEEQEEEVILLETNIDDMNPEFYEYLFEKCFSQGAIDVFITPILMKKNRPASKVSVLSPLSCVDNLRSLLFHETSTFGIRTQKLSRTILKREIISVTTPFGTISVKKGYYQGDLVTVSPEYEDCRKAAEKTGVSLGKVYDEAKKMIP